jgi:hypothetical protein
VAGGPRAVVRTHSLLSHSFLTRAQLDEVDMGMTYAELSLYGRLRKV